MTDDPASASAGEKQADREQMIGQLDVAIAEAVRKIESGRVYNPENERARQGWMRTLADLVRTRNKVLRDKRLDELAERVEQIEERQERARYR